MTGFTSLSVAWDFGKRASRPLPPARGSGSAVSSPSAAVRGGAPTANAFWVNLGPSALMAANIGYFPLKKKHLEMTGFTSLSVAWGFGERAARPLPPARGSGSAVSSPGGVRTANAFLGECRAHITL